MNTIIIATIFVAIVATQVIAFSTAPIAHAPTVSQTTNHLLRLQQSLAGLHFQLEELEDAETSTTDVLLNEDMTISLGDTDGPRYISAEGSWTESCMSDQGDIEEENFQRFFTMKLKRTFISGTDNEKNTHEIGEFKYSVERTYTGECFLVGGTLIAMNGEIHDIDEMFGDRRVGFFNMVRNKDGAFFVASCPSQCTKTYSHCAS